MACWFVTLRDRGVAGRAVVLLLAVAIVYAVGAPVAAVLLGRTAWLVAAAAAIPCLAGSGLALLVSERLRDSKHVKATVLAPMPFRTGVPLLCGLVVHLHGGPLATAGFLYYLLVFYSVTMTVETILSLPGDRKSTPPAEFPRNVTL